MESAALRADSLATLDLARARRLPHLHPLLQATQPGEITYVDVVSASHLDLPSSVDGKSLGFKHCLVFVDAFSGHIRVYFAKKQDEVPTLTRFYLQELGTTLMFGSTFQIRRIHTDGGLPLNNSDFERVLLDYGLAANVTTCPRTPSSNGVAEAAIKYLIQGTAQRLAISGLCKRAWTWAMRHAAVARNKLATRQLDDGRYVTPHELFYGRAPSLSHSVIFGAPCSVLLLGPDRDTLGKFGVPAEKGHVLGHGEDGFQWLGTYRQAMGYVVLLGSNKVVFTKHCRIDERVFAEGGHTHTPFAHAPLPQEQPDADQPPSPSSPRSPSPSSPQLLPQLDATSPTGAHSLLDARQLPQQPPLPPSPLQQLEAASPPTSPVRPRLERISEDDGGAAEQLGGADISKALTRGLDPLRRDRASRSKSRSAAAARPSRAAAAARSAATLTADQVQVPRTYKQAMNSPHAAHWQAAIDDHLRMHDSQKTWHEVLVPSSQKVLPCQWVFAIKTDTQNHIVKWKARTVLFGNLQQKGIDYTETFSPTVRPEQVRLLIAIAAQLQGTLPASTQLSVLSKGDVVDAYLNSELEDPVLSQLPQGYRPSTTAPPGFKVVAENLKAHPGLRQAGRCWYENHRARLIERGFTACASAPCVFVKAYPDGGWLILGNFVDDLLFLNATSNPHAVKELVADLDQHYVVKLQSELEKFLGAEFVSLPEGIVMHLNQYIRGILERFNMADCRPSPTPEACQTDSAHQPDQSLLCRADIQLYQEITGALMFCATSCRPDISHAVNMLARRMATPRACDMTAARRVLRYLKGAAHLGLLFKSATDPVHPHLLAYVDADWASCTEGRRSTSGSIVFYNGSPISWSSGLQSIVALSSTESEYIALSSVCTEISYLRELTNYMHRPPVGPTTIFEDNQGAIHLVENPVHHKRTKHIDVRFHYVREAHERGVVRVSKIHTDLNKADIFTKATTAATFHRHVSAIMFSHDTISGEGGC